MQESPFIEYLIQKYSEQGIEQGSRKMSTKNILSLLKKRFPQSDVNPIEQVLEFILDLDRLIELHSNAIDTPSVEAFLQELDATEA